MRGLTIFGSKSRTARETDCGRPRRILGTELNYIAHPSFEDPSTHDAILAPAPEPVDAQAPGRIKPALCCHLGGFRGAPILSREQETHLFRKMNYLKCLAGRIRDRIDPHHPAAADLDEIERLQTEALKLKNQIIDANLRLVVSFAKKYVRAGYDLPERISDGNLALLLAVDHFDIARGNRFSTYATSAIINQLRSYDRRKGHHRNRPFAPYEDSLAVLDPGSDKRKREEAQDQRRAAVERLLDRLDKRERRVLASRHGIGGGSEQTLRQIGRDLGITRESRPPDRVPRLYQAPEVRPPRVARAIRDLIPAGSSIERRLTAQRSSNPTERPR